jgi:hypothetical protein
MVPFGSTLNQQGSATSAGEHLLTARSISPEIEALGAMAD